MSTTAMPPCTPHRTWACHRKGFWPKNRPQEPGWLIQDLDPEAIKNVRENGQVFNFKDQQRIGYTLHGKPVKVLRCRV